MILAGYDFGLKKQNLSSAEESYKTCQHQNLHSKPAPQQNPSSIYKPTNHDSSSMAETVTKFFLRLFGIIALLICLVFIISLIKECYLQYFVGVSDETNEYEVQPDDISISF